MMAETITFDLSGYTTRDIANIYTYICNFTDNTILNYTHNTHLSLGFDSPLREKDNGIEFKCTLDEELGNIYDFGNNAQHYESIIKLQYDSDVTTQLPVSETMSVSGKFFFVIRILMERETPFFFILPIPVFWVTNAKKSK